MNVIIKRIFQWNIVRQDKAYNDAGKKASAKMPREETCVNP
jgi:hypothetical protein